MIKNVIVLGSSAIAGPVIEDISDLELAVLLNDGYIPGEFEGKFAKEMVAGGSKDAWKYLQQENFYLLVTIMSMKNKKGIYQKLLDMEIPKRKFINVIHPTAIISKKYCSIGTGILAAPLVQCSSGVIINDNCILYGNSFIGHDSILDRYAVLANNVSIGARVQIGKACHIGSNATIREGVIIGDFSVVGAGSVVLKDVPPETIVAGNPAKEIKK